MAVSENISAGSAFSFDSKLSPIATTGCLGSIANSMKEKIHGTQARDIGHKIDSMKRPSVQMGSLLRASCPAFEVLKGR